MAGMVLSEMIADILRLLDMEKNRLRINGGILNAVITYFL